MSEEEVKKMYEEMLEYFGELPNFEHEPKRFAYYVQLFKYYRNRKNS